MNKKGMTIPTLIITLVIVTAFALITEYILNNNYINQQIELVGEEYNFIKVEQLANMAYSNVYFSNLRKGIRKEITVKELIDRMVKDGASLEELNGYEFKIADGEVYITQKGE